ncbi:hypothetical protein AMS68_007677 [Peltaster fructicola]|uniref:Cohesin loading factor n=1 Tax=Peltaster fructicola TaxID=286661 RepID=A0A6H0Y6D2_9PEZI|nr:hypothetical protein AMS68_007677 [Peltaster fructicola]
MSRSSQGYGNTSGGYDYAQQQAHAPHSQQYAHHQQSDAQNGYTYGQARVDASQYRDQFSTTPLPAATHQSQPQHQSWQQNNNLFQEQFYTAHTSPHYNQGTNSSVHASTFQHHGHPAAQSWAQPPPYATQHAQTVASSHQTASYPSPVHMQHQNFHNNYAGQQNLSYHPSRSQQTDHNRNQYMGSAPTFTSPRVSQPDAMTAAHQSRKPMLQPQSVNQQPKPTQPQPLKQAQIPPKTPSLVQDQPHLSKRRKSNDGTALPQHLSISSSHQLARSTTTPSHARLSQGSSTKAHDAELCTVLLALADEYVEAAYSMTVDSNDNQEYQRLIATAIACLESALTSFRQTDVRRESNIRLKLAALIFEETENSDQAEDILGKGIANCERARLPDLRYTMQYLHIQILHSKIPKAAIKAVDKLIDEVGVQKLTHWSFAFRYLKFSLSLGDASVDAVALLRQLTQINELARAHHRVALSCLTSCFETMIGLRTNTTESLELAQRSLADIRSYQLNPDLERLPQLRAMICHLDLACHIAHFSADQMRTAMHVMRVEQDNLSIAKGWQGDGSYVVPLGIKGGESLVLDTPGIFSATETGDIGLKFNWITKGAMLTIGYVLMGMSLLPRNGETLKSEIFFREALKINAVEPSSSESQKAVQEGQPKSAFGPLHAVQEAERQQGSAQAAIKFIMACSFAARAKYGEAVTLLKEFNQEKARDGPQGDIDRARLKFLTASCLQGSGELRKALELYSPLLHDFDAEKKTLPLLKDIQVLAIINSVHILRIMQPDWRDRTETLLKSVEAHCLAHPNKAFASVYHIIESTTAPAHTTIGDVKKTLNHALVPAQAVKNKQLLALIMNMMSETFFTDLVGAQAKSSSNAGRTLAKQSGDELWVAVGSGMLRDTLERSGHLEEAMDANAQARSAIDTLPRAVKASLGLG